MGEADSVKHSPVNCPSSGFVLNVFRVANVKFALVADTLYLLIFLEDAYLNFQT
jgi:hypothetical protein